MKVNVTKTKKYEYEPKILEMRSTCVHECAAMSDSKRLPEPLDAMP